MKKIKEWLLLCSICFIVSGCGSVAEENITRKYPETLSENMEDNKQKEIDKQEGVATDEVEPIVDSDISTDTNDGIVSDSLYDEMAVIEEQYQDYKNLDWETMNQTEMNTATYEMYVCWDNELNSLWQRIIEKVNLEKKGELLSSQRNWIKRKESCVKNAGEEALGGTLQLQLENGTACRFTRQRCYYLAAILAEVTSEDFEIGDDIKESFIGVDDGLDAVFEKFEGQWIFDIDRGACIGVEKATDSYAPIGCAWVVWVTGGDIISDQDVLEYTEDSIRFYHKAYGIDSYYELRRNDEGKVEMAYGNSHDAMDEIVISK